MADFHLHHCFSILVMCNIFFFVCLVFFGGNGVFSCTGHFPCKAISKIVQLPTENG